MLTIFGNDGGIRGCFMVYTFDSTMGRGAVLRMPADNSTLPSANYSDPLMVVGFSCAERESVAFLKAFGGKVYTYAFGHDPNTSVATVHFIGFMVQKNGQAQSNVTSTMLGAYNSNRVSVTKKYATIGLGNAKPISGFILGINYTF